MGKKKHITSYLARKRNKAIQMHTALFTQPLPSLNHIALNH
ncbi:hypothetical protein HMPREF1574_00592 [Gardnerella pickettii JCP7659]|nr:hypothetical protein HMPREF1574_00592 [Gardnerella pickettii JCP7659]EPI59730.1 hypothetical protein HMPREF1580_00744 [Gardnerella vaginalis JCP8070]KXA16257.1 hypothetical protein HMPREF3204_00585 [Gardnerella pickettii]